MIRIKNPLEVKTVTCGRRGAGLAEPPPAAAAARSPPPRGGVSRKDRRNRRYGGKTPAEAQYESMCVSAAQPAGDTRDRASKCISVFSIRPAPRPRARRAPVRGGGAGGERDGGGRRGTVRPTHTRPPPQPVRPSPPSSLLPCASAAKAAASNPSGVFTPWRGPGEAPTQTSRKEPLRRLARTWRTVPAVARIVGGTR